MQGRKANGWREQLRRWIKRLAARLFGGKSAGYRPVRIARRIDRQHISLLLLETGEEHLRGFVRVRVWRCVFRQAAWFDLLITCDRISRTGLRSQEFTAAPTATHRITIARHSKLSTHVKKLRVDVLFLADCCLTDSPGVRGLDGWALPITDSLALQLSKRGEAELRLLTEYKDDDERSRVSNRWLGILRAYCSDYFTSFDPLGDRP